jgi:hypothetical protein
VRRISSLFFDGSAILGNRDREERGRLRGSGVLIKTALSIRVNLNFDFSSRRLILEVEVYGRSHWLAS